MNYSLLKEPRNLTKAEAKGFISDASLERLMQPSVAAYMTGYKLGEDGELIKDPEARDHKCQFYPNIASLELFPTIVNSLATYAPSVLEPKNQREEMRVMKLVDPIYKIQSSVKQEWNELKVDFLLGRNSVIYEELLVDFASFIAVLEEVRKYALANSKQEKPVAEYYANIFSNFDHKTDWFSFILEDILTIGAGSTGSHKVPCDLSNWKKIFWDTHKTKRADFKKFYGI